MKASLVQLLLVAGGLVLDLSGKKEALTPAIVCFVGALIIFALKEDKP